MSTRLKDQNMALCRSCRTITDNPGEACVVCGDRTDIRIPHSLQKVWAWLIAGIICYIPGNLYPITITSGVGGEHPATIMSNVAKMFHHHAYLVGIVIFLFSVVIPISKFAVIIYLALSIQFNWATNEHKRHRAHEMVEFVGRWSMVDVFVVSVLAALIQMGSVMNVIAGVGIHAFALSVILTMVSAMSLDPRLIWDNEGQTKEATAHA